MVDMYGHPVGLHYQKYQKFKTPFGGFMTMASNVVLLLYLSLLFTRLTDNEYNLNKVQNLKNIVVSPGKFQMDTKELQMAVRPKFIYGDTERDIERYFTVYFGPEYYDWVGDEDIKINAQ
jgi:hypothetical protein